MVGLSWLSPALLTKQTLKLHIIRFSALLGCNNHLVLNISWRQSTDIFKDCWAPPRTKDSKQRVVFEKMNVAGTHRARNRKLFPGSDLESCINGWNEWMNEWFFSIKYETKDSSSSSSSSSSSLPGKCCRAVNKLKRELIFTQKRKSEFHITVGENMESLTSRCSVLTVGRAAETLKTT